MQRARKNQVGDGRDEVSLINVSLNIVSGISYYMYFWSPHNVSSPRVLTFLSARSCCNPESGHMVQDALSYGSYIPGNIMFPVIIFSLGSSEIEICLRNSQVQVRKPKGNMKGTYFRENFNHINRLILRHRQVQVTHHWVYTTQLQIIYNLYSR